MKPNGRGPGNVILMNDTKNPGDTTLSVAPAKRLTLKRPVEAGIVRQSFSHGRSKAVVVEKVKRRAVAPGETHAPPREVVAAPPPPPAPKGAPASPPRPTRKHPHRTASGVILRSLTEEEREARSRALSDAREREVEDRKRAEAEAKIREEREGREREERAAAEARKQEEEARRAHEAEAKRRSETEAKRRLAGGEPAPAPSAAAVRRARLSVRPQRPPALLRPPPMPQRHPSWPRKRKPHTSSAGRACRSRLLSLARPGAPNQKSRGRLTVANVTGEASRRAHEVRRGFPPPRSAAQRPCQ